ncbi:hypothetical protein GCM10010259_41300 [Streptomyces daghestanicus]|uniref:Uncharacterized protein n=1 Tax=Streptomyces daghestanicus TaxID=66885 RepID=A0ABQ3Q8G6_9ACTN|nr:hypothetical protein [Streptomyces daghestanicus]GGT17952.1 hypothetical protein GCM10010240_58920 [Streptomyces griseoviridis]GGU46241.1 hypothetical protein GCM10010259_41300 [Streptomyces daghestanicus]GHI33563.1 hypothetical protein Sdagh_52930 [Streptomyces daghestanicus]
MTERGGGSVIDVTSGQGLSGTVCGREGHGRTGIGAVATGARESTRAIHHRFQGEDHLLPEAVHDGAGRSRTPSSRRWPSSPPAPASAPRHGPGTCAACRG